MVIGMEIYSEIRRAYLSGESQRSIANRLGVSRQTVKKYCEGETVPGERKEYLREPTVVTDEVKSFIKDCLEYDQQSHLKKQQHTAKRIYDRLVDELGFEGSYSIIRLAVRELKNQYVPAQADVPLEFDPGDAIQIDWGEVQIYLNNKRITANIFCGRLCYSCDIFVMACFSQNAESFLEAQQRMSISVVSLEGSSLTMPRLQSRKALGHMRSHKQITRTLLLIMYSIQISVIRPAVTRKAW